MEAAPGGMAGMPRREAGRARGGRQAELRQGCRQRPGWEGSSAQAGMRRMPGEGFGQCPGGKEAAPGKGGEECPERAAGIQQRHRLLPGLWGGGDGKRPSHVPPAVCWVQRRHPFPPRRLRHPRSHAHPGRVPRARFLRGRWAGSLPGSLSLLRHCCSLCSRAHRFTSSCAGPRPAGGAGGFSVPGGDTLSPGWLQAPPKEGHFCSSVGIFGSPRTEHFTCVLDRGKMLPAPPGTWSRPPGRAADGHPAALCSWKQSPKPAPAPRDTGEHRGVCTGLAAITRLSRAPPSPVSTFGWEKSPPGAPLQGEEGVQVETQRHIPPGGPGDGRHSPTAGGHKGQCYSLGATLAPAPGKGGDSPFAVSHVTPGLAEIVISLQSCPGNIYVSRGLSPAPDAAPLPRMATKQRRALGCFWESAGIGLHTNSPAQFRLQPRGYF